MSVADFKNSAKILLHSKQWLWPFLVYLTAMMVVQILGEFPKSYDPSQNQFVFSGVIVGILVGIAVGLYSMGWLFGVLICYAKKEVYNLKVLLAKAPQRAWQISVITAIIFLPYFLLIFAAFWVMYFHQGGLSELGAILLMLAILMILGTGYGIIASFFAVAVELSVFLDNVSIKKSFAAGWKNLRTHTGEYIKTWLQFMSVSIVLSVMLILILLPAGIAGSFLSSNDAMNLAYSPLFLIGYAIQNCLVYILLAWGTLAMFLMHLRVKPALV